MRQDQANAQYNKALSIQPAWALAQYNDAESTQATDTARQYNPDNDTAIYARMTPDGAANSIVGIISTWANYFYDFFFNNGWYEYFTSPQSGQLLDKVDGFFAGLSSELPGGSLVLQAREAMWGDAATRNHSGEYFEAGQVTGQIITTVAMIAINPCALSTAALWAFRAYEASQAVFAFQGAYANFSQGNYVAGTVDALGAFGSVASMFRACFVAGTPLLTPEGAKPIEQLVAGDLVLSRDEFNPLGAVRAKHVLLTFETISPILNVLVNGRIIGTTSEHPFWVEGYGFTAAKDLQTGDVFVSHDGQRRVVEGVADSGLVEKVYNIAVEDDHTYFVGGDGWGFSVWAHITCNGLHHYVPVFMGSKVARGSSILTPFLQIGHTGIHRAMNQFLKPLGMTPSRINTGLDIRTTFSKSERLTALVDFYRTYQGGAHYQGFLTEMRLPLKSGMFK